MLKKFFKKTKKNENPHNLDEIEEEPTQINKTPPYNPGGVPSPTKTNNGSAESTTSSYNSASKTAESPKPKPSIEHPAEHRNRAYRSSSSASKHPPESTFATPIGKNRRGGEKEEFELRAGNVHPNRNKDYHRKPTLRRDTPGQIRASHRGPARNDGRIKVDALKVLDAVGISHTLANKIFYLARIVNSHEQIYQDIIEYVQNGQEHEYDLKVCNIVRLVRNNDVEFQHDSKTSQEFRLLLWHGTSIEVVASILENGFVLPPPSGQMFGPGIYFADRVSKSANYCETDRQPGTKAYLFLCDVLLGNTYNARVAHTELTEAPNHTTRTFDSVKCTGEFIPDRRFNRKFHGSLISCGPTIENTKFKEYTVNFNEFIVYCPTNVKIMFLVEVEFLSRPIQDSKYNGRLSDKNPMGYYR